MLNQFGNASELPSMEILRDLFEYHKHGCLIWVNSGKSHKNGQVAGFINNEGYRLLKINGSTYPGGRVVWQFFHGNLKTDQIIDHKNGIRHDDRIENIRIASHCQNMRNRKRSRNNTSGYPGISWYEGHQKFKSSIKINGKRLHLGYYETIFDAVISRKKAESKYHNSFSYTHGGCR